MKHRIYLRSLSLGDYEISVNWRNDPDIQNMVGGHKFFVSPEREKQWVESAIMSDDKLVLAICLVDSGKYIGNVMLQDIDWINRTARAPFMIGDKNYWGNGYATEARMLMLKFAFEERGLQRISAVVLENNIASLRIHEKCGFKKEGLMRNSMFKNGRYYNQYILGVLKDEFEEAYNNYLASIE